MSLLLDALKKAAEAKSRGDTEPTLDDTQPVPPPVPPIPSPPPHVEHRFPDTVPPPARFDASFDPDETFDQTHSDTLGHRFSPYDEFDETQQLEGDFGETTSSAYGSQRHAETVFASKSVQKPLRAGVPMLRMLIALLLIVSSAAGIYWYLQERELSLREDLISIQARAPIVPLPELPEIQINNEAPGNEGTEKVPAIESVGTNSAAESVDRNVAEESEVEQVVVAEAVAEQQAIDTGAVEEVVSGVAVEEVSESMPDTEVELPVDAAQTAQPAAVEQQATPDVEPEPAVAEVTDAAQAATAEKTDDTVIESAAETDKASTQNAVSVTQNTRQNRPDELVNDAYLAYQNGDLARARQLYEDALADDPEHRDALLGRAAIHLKQSESRPAIEIYRRLLARNPRDHDALAGLNSLASDDNIERYETDLRFLLRDNPQSAPLNYALGVLLSRQQRWSAAQGHFFNAFATDASNPDIAFNLAVSLDNMGKSRVAADYYRDALELAKTHAASFDPGAVQQRLAALEQ